MTQFTETIKYRYAMSVKLSHIPASIMSSVFPNVEDLVISSRVFDTFEDAVDSSNGLATEVTASLNESLKTDTYGVMSELNPARTGKDTISKEWAVGEIAKIWIIDMDAHEKNPSSLRAIGLTQLVEVQSDPIQLN